MEGKNLFRTNDKTFSFSIFLARAQASDTGYYTCELNNGRDPVLRRSFDLRVKGKIK